MLRALMNSLFLYLPVSLMGRTPPCGHVSENRGIVRPLFLGNYETGFILLKPQRTLRNNPLPPLLRGIKGDTENAEWLLVIGE